MEKRNCFEVYVDFVIEDVKSGKSKFRMSPAYFDEVDEAEEFIVNVREFIFDAFGSICSSLRSVVQQVTIKSSEDEDDLLK